MPVASTEEIKISLFLNYLTSWLKPEVPENQQDSYASH